MLNMERLEDLVLFAEVVQQTGFAAAARSLGMQRSKLSRRVAELEQRLGVRLLQRNTRSISLTAAGEQIYRHARTLANEARAAFKVAEEMNGEPRGLLRITAPATFAALTLMPLAAEFCQRHRQLDILVDTRNWVPDIVAEGFDLAFCLQSAPLGDSSLVARTIGTVPMMVAASPELVAHGRLSHPVQLCAFKLHARAAQGGLKTLRFVHPAQGEYTHEYLPHLITGSVAVQQAAVIAGMGVACMPRYLCGDALRANQMVDVFEDGSGWGPEPATVYAILPARHGVALSARMFLDFAVPRLAAVLRDEAQSLGVAP
ncbi:MAG: LysR substrate-binding domain-containing protein [Pseudomonadota bacterium]|jgi:DNA-binding transcriptional LysR family regulator|uniref:LysR substrate-binding domain-containing protein n=1 Tax=Burkholderiaceae TaxID=119060 RepID=UPI0010F6EF16|nr:LysR substrate-binding domain-containing protein [Burkholderia sp. 4M9327F10]